MGTIAKTVLGGHKCDQGTLNGNINLQFLSWDLFWPPNMKFLGFSKVDPVRWFFFVFLVVDFGQVF
jgi:hypothetical protein